MREDSVYSGPDNDMLEVLVRRVDGGLLSPQLAELRAVSAGLYGDRYRAVSAVDPETHCYLCGNAAMIYEIYDILQNQGVDTDRIHAEVYF